MSSSTPFLPTPLTSRSASESHTPIPPPTTFTTANHTPLLAITPSHPPSGNASPLSHRSSVSWSASPSHRSRTVGKSPSCIVPIFDHDEPMSMRLQGSYRGVGLHNLSEADGLNASKRIEQVFMEEISELQKDVPGIRHDAALVGKKIPPASAPARLTRTTSASMAQRAVSPSAMSLKRRSSSRMAWSSEEDSSDDPFKLVVGATHVATPVMGNTASGSVKIKRRCRRAL